MNHSEEFSLIRNEVKAIIQDLQQHTNSFQINSIDVVNDNEYGYRAIFDFGSCLGEVLVEQPYFAPYRYVKVEVLSAGSYPYECLFVWYDSAHDDSDSIRRHIIQALQIASDHKDQELRKIQ